MPINMELINKIIKNTIRDTSPYNTVYNRLCEKNFPGRIFVCAVGKAASPMAKASYDALGDKISGGVVVTKYGHSRDIPSLFSVVEAGHPVPDENSVLGAVKCIELVTNLRSDDTVILLLSGGGSALFEKPRVSLEKMAEITDKLLKSGCTINELNCARKHISFVKGGGFGELCKPASVYSLVLSDVIGDPLDVIASGPAYPDSTTRDEAAAILNKYGIEVPFELAETPKILDNVETELIGNLTILCNSAKKTAEDEGYRGVILDTAKEGEASVVAKEFVELAKKSEPGTVLIMGGETTVTVRGKGLGGRNQELALSAAIQLDGDEDITLFAFGSDGTDGPTDAAGGIADGETAEKMRKAGVNPEEYLADNNSYYALKSADALIITGPTGTNVNDLYCAIRKYRT